MVNKKVEEILRRYSSQIERAVRTEKFESEYSKEYLKFKEELSPELSNYEKFAKNAGKIIKLKINEKDKAKINEHLERAHLDVKAEDAVAFSLLSFIISLLIFSLLIATLFLLDIEVPILIIILAFLISIFIYFYVSSLPEKISQQWKLKASSQMVPAILYIVVYMKHTSNLERAIKFASQHLQPPLSLDFKKILWDVETGKYTTIKESLDSYLEGWRTYSPEFIESFHLIESSLYEPSEARRIAVLEKALSVILDGVYDKMLKYTHDVQAPLTNLYMLGIVLPTLAIALLPLASTLLAGTIKWWYVAIFFNLIIPFFVYYLTSGVLVKRPGGYGDTEMLELNPEYPYYKSSIHYYKALIVAIPFFIIGIIPLMVYFGFFPDYSFKEIGMQFPSLEEMKIFGFIDGKGPFGLGALILSFFIPLSIASFLWISYSSKTKKILKMKEETLKLESEFSSSLFQLGNRLGDNIPAEMAFGRVAESSKGTATEGFFRTVNSNIQQFGMSVKEAIFNSSRGAIIYYPSELIRTSMEILVESVKQGLQVAANAMISISQYVKNIGKINERLKDLLADIISSMKSNMSFLAPLLAGIVVGLAAMITTILTKLQQMLSLPGGENIPLAGSTLGNLTKSFNLEAMIPPYWLQIVVGIYLIEIIYILSITLVSVESGVDKLKEKSEIARNMKAGILLYILTALAASLILSMLASIAITV
ncbi:MAG: hypothetical protein QW041_01235 [Candidatus Pacearchaeota archaeon]